MFAIFYYFSYSNEMSNIDFLIANLHMYVCICVCVCMYEEGVSVSELYGSLFWSV